VINVSRQQMTGVISLSLTRIFIYSVSLCLLFTCFAVSAKEPAVLTLQKQPATVYFQALSALMERPIILSPASKKLEISGQFDLTDPKEALKDFSRDMGLIWYFDGQAIYVYRQDELASSLIRLEQLSVDALVRALREAGLYDEQYPLKARPDAHSFYLSGPPKYVQLVTQTAALLDKQQQLVQVEHTGANASVAVVSVRYRPIFARQLTLRGEKITEPGLIDTLRALWQGADRLTLANPRDGRQGDRAVLPPPVVDDTLPPATEGESLALDSPQSTGQQLWVLGDSDTNSIILRGDPAQIRDARFLIQQLDNPRQQVQLSLQIIDVKESEVQQLGIDWSGSFTRGGLIGQINPVESAQTLVQTTSILARIHALTEQSKARIISRPMVLTQDNVTAYFDNNHSFYIKLEAERFVDLKTITYGTLISVTPRIITSPGQPPKVEMQLTVEDGSSDAPANSTNQITSQTRIETVARVPSGDSLLIGGYTRSERIEDQNSIPLLSRIPLLGSLFRYEIPRRTNVVRLFLIEPRVLNEPDSSVTRLDEWLKRTRQETSRSLP
jgi:type III secretion system outer membrane ring protein